MIRKTISRVLSTFILLSLILSFVNVQAAPSPAPVPEVAEASESEPAAQEPPPQGYMAKLDSELRTLAEEGGEETVTVYVRAKAGADLSSVANVKETRPYLDDVLIVAEVEPAMLAKLASDPDVLAAEKFQPIPPPQPLLPGGEERAVPERPSPEEIAEKQAELEALKASLSSSSATPMSEAPMSSVSPQDWYGKDIIGSEAAWAKGYTGEGANVAIVDSGVDFGHPRPGRHAGRLRGWPLRGLAHRARPPLHAPILLQRPHILRQLQ